MPAIPITVTIANRSDTSHSFFSISFFVFMISCFINFMKQNYARCAGQRNGIVQHDLRFAANCATLEVFMNSETDWQ